MTNKPTKEETCNKCNNYKELCYCCDKCGAYRKSTCDCSDDTMKEEKQKMLIVLSLLCFGLFVWSIFLDRRVGLIWFIVYNIERDIITKLIEK